MIRTVNIGLLLLAAWAAAQNASKDISGTWVARVQNPNGDQQEYVYELKVNASGKITGTQKMPFGGDSPIVDGKVNGNDLELTVQTENFGNLQTVVVKGTIDGESLKIQPVMPGGGRGRRGPDSAAGIFVPSGVPPAGGPPAGGPPPDVAAAGRGRGGRGFGPQGPLTFVRGTPTPTYRSPSINYSTLPKVELPARHDVPYNGLAKTPPMGWNSWNKFRTRIDDKTVREIADAMVSSGMKAAGYQYINIDDGWEWKRDDAGRITTNPNFPNMKALSDYVHSKGLKLGIYSSPGPTTCAGYAGSYGHETEDAKTWADWGIDYLKYDWCSASRVWKDEDMPAVYQRMGEALSKAGRPIVFSLCQYGRQKVQEWGPTVSGNLWRTTGDIRDQWTSMANIGFAQGDLAPFAAPGHWNDPDMLEIGNGGMTPVEYRTHFSLWAMLAAPLIAGNDLRSMTPEIHDILTNKDVIAVDQDRLGKQAQRIAKNGDTEVWMRPLDKGGYAVALFNRGADSASVAMRWADLKASGKWKVRDLWEHKDLGAMADGYTATVPSHGVVMVRLSK